MQSQNASANFYCNTFILMSVYLTFYILTVCMYVWSKYSHRPNFSSCIIAENVKNLYMENKLFLWTGDLSSFIILY